MYQDVGHYEIKNNGSLCINIWSLLVIVYKHVGYCARTQQVHNVCRYQTLNSDLTSMVASSTVGAINQVFLRMRVSEVKPFLTKNSLVGYECNRRLQSLGALTHSTEKRDSCLNGMLVGIKNLTNFD